MLIDCMVSGYSLTTSQLASQMNGFCTHLLRLHSSLPVITQSWCWYSTFNCHSPEANFLVKLIYPSVRNNTKMTTLPTLCNCEKTPLRQINMLQHPYERAFKTRSYGAIVIVTIHCNYSRFFIIKRNWQ